MYSKLDMTLKKGIVKLNLKQLYYCIDVFSKDTVANIKDITASLLPKAPGLFAICVVSYVKPWKLQRDVVFLCLQKLALGVLLDPHKFRPLCIKTCCISTTHRHMRLGGGVGGTVLPPSPQNFLENPKIQAESVEVWANFFKRHRDSGKKKKNLWPTPSPQIQIVSYAYALSIWDHISHPAHKFSALSALLWCQFLG